MSTQPAGTPTPYLIHCVEDKDFGSCGTSSYLSGDEYLRQLSDPNRGWRCPVCRSYPCHWDDENYEKFIGDGPEATKYRSDYPEEFE